MSQITRYDFELEKIKIDYFTFSIKNTEEYLQKIAQIFNRVYKFNCYYYDKKIEIKNKKSYFNFTNLFYTLEMVFLFHSNPGNRNTVLIQFSGHNAFQFYNILKS